jgi:hypothetical protein
MLKTLMMALRDLETSCTCAVTGKRLSGRFPGSNDLVATLHEVQKLCRQRRVFSLRFSVFSARGRNPDITNRDVGNPASGN